MDSFRTLMIINSMLTNGCSAWVERASSSSMPWTGVFVLFLSSSSAAEHPHGALGSPVHPNWIWRGNRPHVCLNGALWRVAIARVWAAPRKRRNKTTKETWSTGAANSLPIHELHFGISNAALTRSAAIADSGVNCQGGLFVGIFYICFFSVPASYFQRNRFPKVTYG